MDGNAVWLTPMDEQPGWQKCPACDGKWHIEGSHCPACDDRLRVVGPPERHPSSERFHALLEEAGRLHDLKQADYGRDTDPFSNVRASEAWGMSAWVGAMVRATDKVRRLQTYARKGELANESVQDAFLDLAVYALIAYVLWEEEHQDISDLGDGFA